MHSAEYAAVLGNRYRNLYNKLVESNQEDEESDMEASDADHDGEDSDNEVASRVGRGAAGAPVTPVAPGTVLLPIGGGAYRAVSAAQAAVLAAAAQPHAAILGSSSATSTSGPPPTSGVPTVGFLPRKLSTISSKGSFAATREDEDEDENSPLRGGDSVADPLSESGNDDTTVVERSPMQVRGETTAVIEARPKEEQEETAETTETERLLPSNTSARVTPSSTLAVTRTVTEGKRRYLNTDV